MIAQTWFLLFFLTVGCHAIDLEQNIDDATIMSELNELINQLKSQDTTPDCSSNPELSILLRCMVNRLRSCSQTNATDFGQTIQEARTILEQELGGNRPATNKVPNEAVRLSTGTYIFHLKTMNWGEARQFCRSKGMDLVAIDSEEENTALSEHGKTLGFFAPWNGAWTSGCYSNFYTSFMWHSIGRAPSYSKWWPEYPKSGNRIDGYCIIFYPPDPRWWEVPSHVNLPLICEL